MWSTSSVTPHRSHLSLALAFNWYRVDPVIPFPHLNLCIVTSVSLSPHVVVRRSQTPVPFASSLILWLSLDDIRPISVSCPRECSPLLGRIPVGTTSACSHH